MSVKRVQSGSFLTLHYRLRGPEGDDLVNTFGGQPATLSLGTGELAPAMEQRLLGLAEGAHDTFALAPGEAFGERNADLMQRVTLSLLQRHGAVEAVYAVGDVVEFPTPGGEASYAGVVREVGADALLIDFNHPLAGRPVTFEVELIGVL